MGNNEVEKLFKEWWALIVMPNGEWDLEQVKKELYDYAILMGNVSEVYDHITGGAISKPNTKPEVVIAVADDLVTQMIEEAIKEAGLEED